jgi:hypothetical protein
MNLNDARHSRLLDLWRRPYCACGPSRKQVADGATAVLSSRRQLPTDAAADALVALAVLQGLDSAALLTVGEGQGRRAPRRRSMRPLFRIREHQ